MAALALASIAAATTPAPEHPVILALGDSVAFGMGVPSPETGGFPAVLHRRLCEGDDDCPIGEVVNLAIPGATSTGVRQSQLPPALAVLSDREVALVTLTVGGNDLFDRLLSDCRSGLRSGCRQSMRRVFAEYGENLNVTLDELRRAAGADIPISVMTYYNPLAACVLAPMSPTAQVVLEGGIQPMSGFNDLIRVTAAATETQVAEVSGRLSPGDYVGGLDCIHPNDAGHEKIAAAFLDSLPGVG